MNEIFSSDEIANRGWRQGAILPIEMGEHVRPHAPESIDIDSNDIFVVTSHDCDIVNFSIEKEPVVEILRASRINSEVLDQQQLWARNPRTLQLEVKIDDSPTGLSFSVHDRWFIPRNLLMRSEPRAFLPNKERRIIAEWLAKRYIRAAFPTAFDQRWRNKLKNWQKLLKKNSEWIQGVYLRLSTMDELSQDTPYKCHLILAADNTQGKDWSQKKSDLETTIKEFWDQFNPTIECVGVEVYRTDEVTLADIELYQRFDSDWVSYEDDTPVVPVAVDMTF